MSFSNYSKKYIKPVTLLLFLLGTVFLVVIALKILVTDTPVRDPFSWVNMSNPWIGRMLSIEDPDYSREYKEIEKYNRTIWVLMPSGIEVPPKIKVFHMELEIMTEKYEFYRTWIFRTYFLIHNFFKMHGQTLRISRGQLVSYVRDNTFMLPWDLDVDLGTTVDGLKLLNESYEKGTKDVCGKYRWCFCRAEILGVPVVISVPRDEKRPVSFYKVLVDYRAFGYPKIPVPVTDYCVDVSKMHMVPVEEVTMSGLQVMAPSKEWSSKEVVRLYGERVLQVKRHEDLQGYP